MMEELLISTELLKYNYEVKELVFKSTKEEQGTSLSVPKGGDKQKGSVSDSFSQACYCQCRFNCPWIFEDLKFPNKNKCTMTCEPSTCYSYFYWGKKKQQGRLCDGNKKLPKVNAVKYLKCCSKHVSMFQHLFLCKE